jgi:hypothetical protein
MDAGQEKRTRGEGVVKLEALIDLDVSYLLLQHHAPRCQV